MTARSSSARPLFLAVLLVVAAWPPANGRSLLMKAVNFAVDPMDSLPVLPPQLGYGLSDDVRAVEERDAMVRAYDDAYDRDVLTRRRLELKVARDPFEASTERQVLLVFGVLVAYRTARRAGWR